MSSDTNFPFTPADFVPCLLDLLHIETDHLGALRKLFWKIMDFLDPFLFRLLLLDHAKKMLKQNALLKTRDAMLLFVLLISLPLT